MINEYDLVKDHFGEVNSCQVTIEHAINYAEVLRLHNCNHHETVVDATPDLYHHTATAFSEGKYYDLHGKILESFKSDLEDKLDTLECEEKDPYNGLPLQLT